MTRSPTLRWSLAVLLLAVAVVATGGMSEAFRAARSLEASDDALAHDDRTNAIVFARDAARASLPWLDAPRLANVQIASIAEEREAHGDFATATLAWRALYEVAIETRSPFHARATADIARQAEDGLARVALRASLAADPTQTDHVDLGTRAALAHETRNAPPTSATLALLSFGALLFFGGSALLLASFGHRTAGARFSSRARIAATVATAGLALYAFTYLAG